MEPENSPSAVMSEASSAEASHCSTEEGVRRHWQGVVKRRSFLKGFGVASATLSAGALLGTEGNAIGEIHYQACGNLLHSVQTGSPAFNNVFGASLFDYLRQNGDAADAFNQGMANVSSMWASAVLM